MTVGKDYEYRHKYTKEGAGFLDGQKWSEWTEEDVNKFIRRMAREGEKVAVYKTYKRRKGKKDGRMKYGEEE
jgi:hypothetical protein